MGAAKVYFILYIVLLCELFIVIIERDDAQDSWIKDLKQHNKQYKLTFLNLEKEISFNLNNKKDYLEFNLFPSGISTNKEIDRTSLNILVSKDGKEIIHKVLTPDKKMDVFSNGNYKIIVQKISLAYSTSLLFKVQADFKGLGNNDKVEFKCWFEIEKRMLPENIPEEVQETFKGNMVNDKKMRDTLDNLYEMVLNKKGISDIYKFDVKTSGGSTTLPAN